MYPLPSDFMREIQVLLGRCVDVYLELEIVCRSVTSGNEECMGRMQASPGALSM
uniref:Uncharacterized protein n=1 Tax=Peronospora matthiolae TaxID=2874970 RepID=A0AAV1U6H3_9STRA